MVLKPAVKRFQDGIVVLGDFLDPRVQEVVHEHAPYPLVMADPPYGGIINEQWDKIECDIQHSKWLVRCAKALERLCCNGASLYMWGGYGTPGNRPFYRFVIDAERETAWNMAMMLTWRKKRAYGVQHNYLSTREECAYFVKGDIKKPRMFNVPLLDKERGYDGYDRRYPARSKFLRRTAVWDDVTELLRGKLATTQKPVRLYEVPIEVHTHPGECVLDPFAGTGTAAVAARKLGRRFVLVERDQKACAICCDRITAC